METVGAFFPKYRKVRPPTSNAAPFVFRHTGIEFCCGMTLDHDNTNLLIGFGEEDRRAFFAVITVEAVRKMLHSLP